MGGGGRGPCPLKNILIFNYFNLMLDQEGSRICFIPSTGRPTDMLVEDRGILEGGGGGGFRVSEKAGH